ncbi:MAG: 3-hydroxybutyryl-CoA dehydrogenase [FCB group bacterium]|nr:3-hydroxybutyryl-CoA dehydrogenase [FCB group bacterium]
MNDVSVIGSGTMGNGIAQVFALHGYKVNLIDIKQELLDKAINTISNSLERFLKKEKITREQKTMTLNNIKTTTDINDIKNAQLVVEAVTENYDIKVRLYRQIDDICSPDTIFASNTSSLPITKLASQTKRPDKFIGMHFMNPVPMMKLVELIRGFATSEETGDFIRKLSEKLDKVPVEVNDYPGFIGNRLLMPLINEAIFTLMEGVATAEAIDNIMRLGMGHPMGPLTLADFIGLDVCLAIMRVMYEGLGNPKYYPCPLLIKMVEAGFLGRKSGHGFFKYDK